MEPNDEQVVLNIGCGFKKMIGCVNVDAFDNCEPDVVHDLNSVPWPWENDTVDRILAWHIMEHLPKWWEAFRECNRVLKVGGTLSIRVPDHTRSGALAYRDHLHIFDPWSFHGLAHGKNMRAHNAWAEAEEKTDLIMVDYARSPFEKYQWIPKFVMGWLAGHCINFIYEQEFVFQKMERLPDGEVTA